ADSSASPRHQGDVPIQSEMCVHRLRRLLLSVAFTSKRGSATLGSIVGNPQHPGAACLWPRRRRRLTMAGPSARLSNLLLQPLFADLAVEGGAADAQTTGDLRHVAGIDLDRVLDQV